MWVEQLLNLNVYAIVLIQPSWYIVTYDKPNYVGGPKGAKLKLI